MIFLKRRALMTRAGFNYKTVSGIGSVVLENCVETKFKRLELLGNSAQTTTKGLQLLDKTKIPTPQAGVAYYNMQVEEGKYTLSTKYRRAVQKDLFLFAGEVDTGTSSNINGVDSTISRTVESINGYITIGYRKGENGVNPFDFETMLNKGDTPLPYEPYTDGKPSPSVEYPQEIVSAGKLNADTGKYDIDMQVIRNLFNHTKAKSGWIATSDGKQSLVALGGSDNVVSDYIPVHSEIKYIVSTPAYKFFYDSDKNFLKYETLSSSIVIPNNAKYMIVIVPVNRGTVIQTAKKLIIYESDTGLKTLKLSLDRPLTKWDRIEKRDGVYGIVCKHRTVDDLATLVKDNTIIYGSSGNRYFSIEIKDANLNYDYSKVYSEVGLYKKDINVLYVPRVQINSFTVYVSDTDTIETAKEHLHYKVIYETDSEEFVPLPQEIQLALDSLHANDGTTVITVDSGEVETGIGVEYAVKE